MTKRQYKFNPQTLAYELVVIPFRIKVYRILRKVLIGFLLASMANLVFSLFFYTPKMYRILEEKSALVLKYNILNDKLRAATTRLNEIHHRDNHVYRSLFGTDSLSSSSIFAEYPDEKYLRLQGDAYTPLMVKTWKEMDALSRLLYLQSVSMDELESLSKDKEKMAEAIPAIWPIDKRGLRGAIGAFGTRRHPISGRMTGHTGIDLGGRIGAPVYATGNGRIAFNNEGETGYGKQVLINHGFGYKTRYAHLNKVLVAPGQEVKRGEIIGELGNTGRSTGPHLHYEVIYMGHHVDPLNYFSRDMTEAEFAKIIESAQTTTYELP